MVDLSRRATLIARGAAEWRDRGSMVRNQAREALRAAGAPWSAPVIEAALDDVLHDLDEARAATLTRDVEPRDPRRVLVILPGNVIGPTIASAFCAAAAGAKAILKSPGSERALAPILIEQFGRLGYPLGRTLDARYWTADDRLALSDAVEKSRRAIIFASDETIDAIVEQVRELEVLAYGSSFSVGFVGLGANAAGAAAAAARDICIFDQRGCMSPQTIYVEGDEARTIAFAHALAAALRTTGEALPRARLEAGEREAVAEWIRRLSVTALPARTHALDTLLLGPRAGDVPEFVVVAEPSGPPTLAQFGRIVAVKPCSSIAHFSSLKHAACLQYETVGYAGTPELPANDALLLYQTAPRVCALGEMQRPPFGYRPEIEDFA